MSLQTWQETLVTLQTDGTALGNTITATSLFGATTVAAAQGRFTLPANFFTVGRTIRVTAKGRISNIVTTPGTFTPSIRFGAVTVFTGGAVPLNIVAKTNVSFILDAMLTCRTIGGGTTATVLGIGQLTSESVLSSAAGVANTCLLPASAPAAGTGFDSTTTNQVDIFGAWSIANAGNTITLHSYMLESMN